MIHPLTFDNDTGSVLGAMPDGVVKINSSLIMLAGKFVDADGIVYGADGLVDEPATAAYAREVAAGRIAAPYDVAPSKDEQRADSVQQNSNADYVSTYVDSMVDNAYTTAAELPGRVADAASGAFNIGKWLVVGLVAVAVIKGMDRIPSRGHVKRYTRRKIREVRQRAAKYIAR